MMRLRSGKEPPCAGLAGQMEDAVKACEVEGILGEIDATHVEAARVLFLQRRVVIVGEAVEADHVVTRGGQRLGEV